MCFGRVLNGTALFQELFFSWLKDFGPPVCPTWSYLNRPKRPRTSQDTLQIRSWKWRPSYFMLETGAEWHCTVPGAIPQLAEGFWGLRWAQMAWDDLKFAPRWPKTVQDRPEMVHRKPNMAIGWRQDDPKILEMTQASPKMAPRWHWVGFILRLSWVHLWSVLKRAV